MNLSPLEAAAFAALERARRPLSLEEIADAIYEGRERPEHWRSSASAIMRYLRMKTNSDKRRVVRTSGLGAGVKGEYTIADAG